ncbi:MAG: SRPBCC family protein [Spongiibacteraceae bacterium]
MAFPENYNTIVKKMIDHVNNKTTDQSDSTLTVPYSAYTDSEIWEKEMQLIFKKLPVMVALTQEIPNAGDFKTLQFLDKPLLITRLKDGSAKVMLNVCAHRAMAITSELSGNKSRFTCPYHGWMYTNDGTLKSVAEPEKFGDFDKSTHGLTQLPVYERGGLIFTVLQPDGEVDFEKFLGEAMADLERLKFDQWHYCGKREIFGANWKVAYDGYLEGYHFAAAHPQTIHQRTFSNVMEFDSYGPHILLGFPQRSIKDLEDVPEEEYWKHENYGYDFIRTLFPNVSIFVAPEITQISQIIPGPTPAENKTYLNFIHPNKPETKEQETANEEMMEWLRDVVDKEDYQVGLKIQKGLESNAYQQVTFGKNERGNQYFHNWVNYYLADDPSLPEPKL